MDIPLSVIPCLPHCPRCTGPLPGPLWLPCHPVGLHGWAPLLVLILSVTCIAVQPQPKPAMVAKRRGGSNGPHDVYMRVSPVKGGGCLRGWSFRVPVCGCWAGRKKPVHLPVTFRRLNGIHFVYGTEVHGGRQKNAKAGEGATSGGGVGGGGVGG